MKRQEIANSEQRTGRRVLAALIVGAYCLAAAGQQIQLGESNTAAATAKKQHVLLLSDAVDIAEGTAQTVELRFRVDPGFHINSHKPKDELLIPTSLKLDETGGLKVLGEEYPAGADFKIGSGDASETLDVYQGEFVVRLRLTVPKGSSNLSGTLRYQACDNAACFPPRSLPVRVAVTAK